MRYKHFGNTELQVSEIGFGCSRIGGVFAGESSGVLRVLHHALDAGITFYDTADIYAQGESESLIGRAFRDRRDKVILASKGGYCLPAQRKLVAKVKPLLRPIVKALGLKRKHLPASVTGTLSQDFSPQYLVQALEASLRRLQTNYLDIYQLHSPPTPILQSGECIEVLESLKRQGKIRYYGVAADAPEDTLLCLQYPQISTIQMPFGLLDLEGLDSILPQAEAQGKGIIARGCFGGGLLKETLTEQELKEMTPKWPQIFAYRRIASGRGRPLLEMALQFCLRTPGISVTLLGMRTESHLMDNLRYYSAHPLTEEEYAEIVSVRDGVLLRDSI
ncbi:MAG TPA: aldo/keto reductase [Chthonomonadales bacterium]|nr:aldo/keto reductase [Chthonomonadales bacterium]